MKKRSITRILKTKNTETNGRWLIETTIQQLNEAKREYDKVIDGYNSEEGTHFSRINPIHNNDEMIQVAKSFSRKLSNNDDPIPSKSLAKKGPVMVTYNMHHNNDNKKPAHA